MTDEQSDGNQPQAQKEQPQRNARERLKDFGFIDMTRPGSGTAFIGGVRSPQDDEEGK